MAVLLATPAVARAGTRTGLDALLNGVAAAVVLVEVRGHGLIAVHDPAVAGRVPAPPGSTLKPFALAELLRSGKLSAVERFTCSGRLSVGGRSFNCSHPPVLSGLDLSSALAYSCNCFMAHFAARFADGELAMACERDGLVSRTGWMGPDEATGRMERARGKESAQMQALGEDGVLVTAAGLAAGYRNLALSAPAPVRDGLECAVEFGTAQLARVPGLSVAGKTGSVRTSAGARVAWFAGFAPSRAPEVAAVVMLQGRSGGADAAPVAARVFEAWHAGRL